MLDCDHLDQNVSVVDPVDDPELAAAGRVPTLEPSAERLDDARRAPSAVTIQ